MIGSAIILHHGRYDLLKPTSTENVPPRDFKPFALPIAMLLVIEDCIIKDLGLDSGFSSSRKSDVIAIQKGFVDCKEIELPYPTRHQTPGHHDLQN